MMTRNLNQILIQKVIVNSCLRLSWIWIWTCDQPEPSYWVHTTDPALDVYSTGAGHA